MPIVTPPARLIVRLVIAGAVVNTSSGIVNAPALAPKVILVAEPTVKVPLVLAIGVAPV